MLGRLERKSELIADKDENVPTQGHGAIVRHKPRKTARASESGAQANPVEIIKRRLFDVLTSRLGIMGSALLVSAILIWWDWDKVRMLPGLQWAIDWVQELRPPPQASGTKFSIALATLENGPDGRHWNVLVEALAPQRGIELLVARRTMRC